MFEKVIRPVVQDLRKLRITAIIMCLIVILVLIQNSLAQMTDDNPVVKETAIDGHSVKEITFPQLEKGKTVTETNTGIETIQYIGKTDAKLMVMKNITRLKSKNEFECDCTFKIEANKTETRTCDVCYNETWETVETMMPLEVGDKITDKTKIYEVMKCTQIGKKNEGWGCLAWTNVTITGMSVEGASWLDETWKKCRKFTNSSPVDTGERRINITFGNDDILYADFLPGDARDIRITNGTDCNSDNGTIISFWNETSNTADTVTNFTIWIELPGNNTNFLMYYNATEVESLFDINATFNDNYIDKDRTAGWTVNDGFAVATDGEFLKMYDITPILGWAYRTDFTSPDLWEFHIRRKNNNSHATLDIVQVSTGDGGTSHRFTNTQIPRAGQVQTSAFIFVNPDLPTLCTNCWTEGVEQVVVHKVNESDSSNGVSFHIFTPNRTLKFSNTTGIGFSYQTPSDMDTIAIGGNTGAGSSKSVSWVRWGFVTEWQTIGYLMGAEETEYTPPPPPITSYDGFIGITKNTVLFRIGCTWDNSTDYCLTGISAGYNTTTDEILCCLVVMV